MEKIKARFADDGSLEAPDSAYYVLLMIAYIFYSKFDIAMVAIQKKGIQLGEIEECTANLIIDLSKLLKVEYNTLFPSELDTTNGSFVFEKSFESTRFFV